MDYSIGEADEQKCVCEDLRCIYYNSIVPVHIEARPPIPRHHAHRGALKRHPRPAAASDAASGPTEKPALLREAEYTTALAAAPHAIARRHHMDGRKLGMGRG
jgi:hypothetical protein